MPQPDEVVAPGFLIHYRDDGIIVYIARDGTRASVDAWFTTTTRHDVDAAQRGEHLRRMLVFEGDFFPSPYAVSRAWTANAQTPPELRESLALVATNSLAYRFIVRAFSRLPVIVQASARVFLTEEDALAWLNARLGELGP